MLICRSPSLLPRAKPGDAAAVARPIRVAVVAAAIAVLLSGTAFASRGPVFTALYSFGVVDATQNSPAGLLVQDQTAKLYGELNGNRSQIYEISPSGAERVLWLPPQYPAPPTVCYTGMTLGTDGLLYGTCEQWNGNISASGVIFQYNPKLKQKGFNVIYTFPAFGNGGYEYPSALTLGTDGNFYGTTHGEDTNAPLGSVFKVTPAGVFTTLHVFQGAPENDGAYPSSVDTGAAVNPIPLILGSDGNFYGTTNGGGLSGQQNGGTVYQITPEGAVTILYYFPNGTNGLAGVTEQNGNFFGQTAGGGTNSDGTIYELTPDGTLTTLHNFDQTADSAAIPDFLLTIGNDGNFYDASSDYNAGGYGPESLYEITPTGTYTDLYNGFITSGGCTTTSACIPNSPLYLHTNGKFYGVTAQGGAEGRGVFYSLRPARSAPFVRLQFPLGKVGASLGILGQGFSHATSVSFNGVPTDFKVVTDGYLKATVPAGVTRGYVTVTTPSGTLTSNIAFNPTR